jgi:hypothetical protein
MKEPARTKDILAIIILVLLSVSAVAGKRLEVPSEEYATIMHAIAQAQNGDTVTVGAGTYREDVTLSPGVSLVARQPLSATIHGGGRERAVVLSHDAVVDGFVITGATVGVYSSGTGNVVRRCMIRGNQQTGIMCVGHLPRLEDNLIVFNGGSGLQGWDVRSTIASINHNTIAYNGNHGISIGGNSDLVVENNLIVHNEKVGLKTEPAVRINLKNNVFYSNTELTGVLPSDNFSFDPMFVAPKQLNFELEEQSRCRRRGNDNQDIGARLPF